MKYPSVPDLKELVEQITLYAQLKHEYGAKGIKPLLQEARRNLRRTLVQLKRLRADRTRGQQEPNELEAIQSLRPPGPRRIWKGFDTAIYRSKVEGALLGRMAGCTLGAPVEAWSIERMQALAQENGDDFPPRDYWSAVPEPWVLRYGVSPRSAYTREGMNGVPVDDDLAYTILGLLIFEQFGPKFTTEDVGRAWLKYLPYACTAEKVALGNLKKGYPARRAAEKDNPYCEWIGADIRADPWGYLAPGWPERAAEMAYRDAFLSHRRQGIYGEMFFAAAIAAAFTVEDPVDALRIGLTEIPAHCALARAIRWALRIAPEIRDHQQARDAVERRFPGMHPVHTINNACLTVWGITIGGTDLTRVIGETVAMGLDNDCTAATAGSIVGAVVGKNGIPRHWYRRFNNTIHSYLIGHKKFTISGLVERFARQAARVHESAEASAVS
ncbi:MAG: ADP-ribosylglycohydrolase family protein [Kiritimatiellae bacterium]|nr:ADP-ribosylglycohydrolase family protein [Kiritimatiellia bacterium]